MQFVTRIIAMSRTMRLARELREIDQRVAALSKTHARNLALLTLRETTRAGQCEFPHLYGTPSDQRYSPWGTGTQVGITRARSDNMQIQLRGIALWLAVAYYETRSATTTQAEAIHTQVERIILRLRRNVPDELADAVRNGASEAAA